MFELDVDKVMPTFLFNVVSQSGRSGRRMRCWVYILASKRSGTLYAGVTSNLDARVYQHKHDLFSGFTKRYGVHRLVWFEEHDDIRQAIEREKQIKGWNRAWKVRMIEKINPDWKDLYTTDLADIQSVHGSPSLAVLRTARRG